MKIQPNIIFFWSTGLKTKVQKGCFSQWWPCQFKIDGQTYNCAEQYMMAMKAKAFNDMEALSGILTSNNPKEIKTLGRLVKGFNPTIWNKIKFNIVVKGNYAKFSQNPELKDFLLSTGDTTIAEASPKDSIWGIGLAEDDPRAQNPETWKGENLLGKAIMEVRKMLRSSRFQAKYDVIFEDYVISDNFHNRYWSRAQNFKANGPDDFKDVSLMNPLFMSLHPARTIWYAKDKNDVYVAVLELNPNKKICDLTNPEDVKDIGLPMPIAKMFQDVEPYFSFTSKTNPPKDAGLVPDQLKLATFVLKGLAAYAKVRGAVSVPELLVNAKKSEKVFSEYDKLLSSADSGNATLYPIYIGLKEFAKAPKMTQSKAYADLANEYAVKLEKIFSENGAELAKRDSEIFSEIRAYFDAFRSLAGNADKAVNGLDVNIIKATYMEGLQELLHRQIARCGYCGYYCREKARARGFTTPSKKYKSLCLFDTSAIVSVKTVSIGLFETAYYKLRRNKYADSIKGVKDAVYEDILTFCDDYDNKKFEFEFSVKLMYNDGRTLNIPKLIVNMSRKDANESYDDNAIRRIVKERILKWLRSRKDITPEFAVTSKITPVQNEMLKTALFTVKSHPEITINF